ncbi:MAG: 50S ribosomal protein L19e [archaeon]
MKLDTQKRLAGHLLKCSPKKIKFDPKRLDEIREAITKTDIRGLIGDKAIIREPKRGISRVRARKIAKQKRKGLRKGPGSRKGTPNARLPSKTRWITAVRVQRNFLKELKDKELVTPQDYRKLYRKVKGGFFRSKRHIKLFIEEHDMVKKKEKKVEAKKEKEPEVKSEKNTVKKENGKPQDIQGKVQKKKAR